MHRLKYIQLNGPSIRRLFCTQVEGIPLNKLTVSAVKETFEGERRVALSPAAVKQLCSKGFNVQVLLQKIINFSTATFLNAAKRGVFLTTFLTVHSPTDNTFIYALISTQQIVAS
ncbi:hypothetical protein GCK32_021221 [Trichostrongylus colubriformis]|uniref:Uncharacterized protein n=1 Tax=Trichostrongylus colubriformis TaxID=6319 RepID=A0AAN8INK3_TRICO